MKSETLHLLGEIERHARKQFHFRQEVGALIEIAIATKKTDVFEDIVFYAKFVTNAARIMSRIGITGEGYDRLAAEFRESLEKASTLLKTLVKDSPDETKALFTGKFFQLDQESLARLMQLCADLTSVKNWMLDGKKIW